MIVHFIILYIAEGSAGNANSVLDLDLILGVD
jgi:hypothetical protein